MASLFETQAPRPLADRLRPMSLDEVLGQDHVLAAEAPIGRMVGAGRLASMILWGPPGCGKTTIARLLADVGGLAFEPLSAVFSGVADLRKVFERAKERRVLGQGTLLFIDEIHTMVGAGGAEGQNDAANLLKPALARGELRTIGATTWAEYKKYFEKDPALTRRFQVVKIEEPSEEMAIRMMRGIAPKFEGHHGVRILDEAVIEDTARRIARVRAGDEGREGLAAFLEKRKPKWQSE